MPPCNRRSRTRGSHAREVYPQGIPQRRDQRDTPVSIDFDWIGDQLATRALELTPGLLATEGAGVRPSHRWPVLTAPTIFQPFPRVGDESSSPTIVG